MPQPFRHVSVSSPGKLVIAGEYAVLYGASALALAIDRRARCTLKISEEGLWQLTGSPPFWNESVSLQELLSESRNDLVGTVLSWFSHRTSLPENAILHMDTAGFYSEQQKLGLGSSASVLVNLYASFATLTEHPMNVEDLLDVYRATDQHGSGVDVLTCYYGGFIQLKRQTVSKEEFPSGIYLDFYSVGFSTETRKMVARFRSAFDGLPVTLQDSFITAANKVADSLTDSLSFFTALQHFVQVYRDVDMETELPIWGTQHETMHLLATEVGALYKPSGAGGGDVGVAVATEPQKLAALRRKVTDLPVTVLDLQKDIDGFRIEKTA
ncbi:MAG: hypothetical protein F4227_06725 [Gammaproteobacteria bacterium]|nr:hypothetical protein [Gammaproteobacteria bacterium]MYF02654.1 hypothetical protein [Gammaproteobacteria bacterium]MYI76986.1 hypothetical protein [Gammaproteobacteria bacterium]